MEIVSNCEPWTVHRLASHALNNQLFWAGTATGEETVSFEATMGAELYSGGLAQFAGEVARRALDRWSTDGVFDSNEALGRLRPLTQRPTSVVVLARPLTDPNSTLSVVGSARLQEPDLFGERHEPRPYIVTVQVLDERRHH